MGKKDDRTPKEKSDWEAGEFSEEEASSMGMTKEQANQARAEQERDLGNPLAPPS